MTAPTLRPLRLDDMAAAAALQNAVYAPLYHEPAEILASRVIAAPRLCWGAFAGEALIAYILSHPWPAGTVPALNSLLGAIPQGVTNWYLHDLALLPAGLSDLLPPEAEREAAIVESMLGAFGRHGYERVKPPLLEFEESLLSGSGAAVSEQTFRLMDPVSQRLMGP